MNNPNLIIPTYSVIMLVYHRTPELVEMARNCVASVKNSSKDFEFIIVDNGSTQRYAWEKECDTYIRFNKNMGISHGWNTGLRVSRGKYKAVIGDDVIVRKGWLEALRVAMDQPQAGIANVYVEHLPQGAGIVENYKWFSHACFMLTQKTLDIVGYYDQDTYYPCNFEDHDFLTRLLKKGLKCYVNYGMSVMHKEGQTVHAPDLSEHFQRLKIAFMRKHGFDNQDVFCGEKPFPFT